MKKDSAVAGRQAGGKLAIILVTHGGIGRSLLDVARYILGAPLENFAVVTVPFMSELDGETGPNQAAPFAARQRVIRQGISAAIEAVAHRGEGMLILTDLLGGTGYNAARELLGNDPVAIVTGVNLPMVLKAAELATTDPATAAEELTKRSRRAIVNRFLPEV